MNNMLLLSILFLTGLFTFVGCNFGYAAQYINDDFDIQFQYPDDWKVTQKNVMTTYGIEQDITRLFEIKSPEIFDWNRFYSTNNMSDAATIGVVFYPDVLDLKQFTKIVKK